MLKVQCDSPIGTSTFLIHCYDHVTFQRENARDNFDSVNNTYSRSRDSIFYRKTNTDLCQSGVQIAAQTRVR